MWYATVFVVSGAYGSLSFLKMNELCQSHQTRNDQTCENSKCMDTGVRIYLYVDIYILIYIYIYVECKKKYREGTAVSERKIA